MIYHSHHFIAKSGVTGREERTGPHLLSKYYLSAEPAAGGEVYRDAGRSLLIYKRTADNEWKLYLDIDQATPDAQF